VCTHTYNKNRYGNVIAFYHWYSSV